MSAGLAEASCSVAGLVYRCTQQTLSLSFVLLATNTASGCVYSLHVPSALIKTGTYPARSILIDRLGSMSVVMRTYDYEYTCRYTDKFYILSTTVLGSWIVMYASVILPILHISSEESAASNAAILIG